MKKKAFFFTLLVFIFSFLVLISVTAWIRTMESLEKQDVSSVRITKMNEFSNRVKDDAVRSTQLTGFNALRTAATYVASNNQSKFLNNLNCINNFCIYELMHNVTIEGNSNYTNWNGVNISFSAPDQMGNFTLLTWDQKITRLANASDFNISIARMDVAVFQSDPWNVKIGYNLYFNISDRTLDSVFRTDMVPVLVTIPITNYTYSGG
ncbi:hypothetical protein H0N99_04320 [Candidatus Micrarchaeota archaeon]|nr:hypothetical protein [Candidatus Micrarchaeota archaeon]